MPVYKFRDGEVIREDGIYNPLNEKQRESRASVLVIISRTDTDDKKIVSDEDENV